MQSYLLPTVTQVFDGENGQPVVEVPLDGTQYALDTGKVGRDLDLGCIVIRLGHGQGR